MRHHARYGLVFLCYRSLRLLIIHAEVTEYAQVVVASIIEDAVLDICISAVGIVVECLQFTVGSVVCLHIGLQLFLFLYQLAADIDSQSQVNVSVHLCFFAEKHGVHAVEIIDERIETRHLNIVLLDHLTERNSLRLKLLKLFRSLMTGIRHIENIPIALRIEHDGILVSLFYNTDEFLNHSQLLRLGSLVLFLQVYVIVGQFSTQHIERCVQVGLLEHSVAWQHESYHQQNYDV